MHPSLVRLIEHYGRAAVDREAIQVLGYPAVMIDRRSESQKLLGHIEKHFCPF